MAPAFSATDALMGKPMHGLPTGMTTGNTAIRY